MQTSEYLQSALAVVGLSLITWTKVSFTRRQQADPRVNAWSKRENAVRAVAWTLIGIALVFVFFPF